MEKLTYYCYIFALLLFVQGVQSNDYTLMINGELKEKKTLSLNPIEFYTPSGEHIRIIISLPDGSSINDCNNCTNNNATLHHELVRTDEPNTPGLDDKCFSNIDCLNVPYSECILGKCSCQPNYTPSGGRCFGLIDEACELDSHCGVAGSECKSGFCKCKSGYYSSGNENCYRFARGLHEYCHATRKCPTVFSECINEKCQCKSKYIELNNTCYGSRNAECSKSSDCHSPMYSCKLGTCQEVDYENYTVVEFVPVGSACPITVCPDWKDSLPENYQCNCKKGYYQDDNNCYQIPSGPEIAVNTSKACNFLANSYYADGKCHSYVRNFKDSCHAPNGCKIDFSTCSNGKCVCKSKYLPYNNVCYGLPNAECTKPSDCLSTSYSCVSGTCQNVDFTQKPDKLVSKKPGITSYWIKDSNGEKASQGVFAGEDGPSLAMYVCRVTRKNIVVPGKLTKEYRTCNANITNSESHDPSYELLIGNDVKWKKTNFTLDKAIFGGHNKDGLPYLSCRVNITSKDAAAGNLEPPLYNECFIPYGNKITPYSEFDVLIHK